MKSERLRVILATANPDKAAEIADVVGDWLALEPRPAWVPYVDESEATLEGNARLKARAIAAATGAPALADDTGLVVAALGGAPGVLAARYAGEGASYGDNVDKLLRELAPCQDRRAQFRSVMVLALPDGREIVAEGAIDGEIAPARRGERGFGYDPVFIPDGGGGRTFAEMSAAEKDSLGHRGRALRALRRELERVGITSL